MLAAVTLGTLLIATLVRLDWSSHALSEAADGAGGAVAEQLALSAIAEAVWRFQSEGNRPDEPLFDRLREKLEQCRRAVDLSTLLAPARLQAALKNDHEGAFGLASIERFEARLDPPGARRALTLRCTVRVDHGLGYFVRRTAEEKHFIGVTGMFLPQPLDQLTAGILSVPVLDEHTGAVGRWLDALEQFNRMLANYRALIEALRALGDAEGAHDFTMMPVYFTGARFQDFTAPEQAVVASQRAAQPWREHEDMLDAMHHGPAHSRRYLDRLRDDVYAAARTPLRFTVRRSRADTRPVRQEDARPSRVLAELEHPFNALISLADQVELEHWDPNRRYFDMLQKSERALAAITDRIGRVFKDVALTDELRQHYDDGGIRVFQNEMDRLIDEAEAAIERGTGAMVGFTREMHGETRAPLALVQGDFVEPDVTAVVHPGEMKEWQKRFGGTNGSVVVEYTAEERRQVIDAALERHEVPAPADIDLARWQGKARIALKFAEASLRSFTVEDRARDRLVLLAEKLHFNANHVDAAALARTAEWHGAPEIQGALVLRTLPVTPSRADPARMQGTVIRDERGLAGVYVDAAYPDKVKKDPPDWHRVCRASYLLMLHPQGWTRQVRQSRGWELW